jgi:hypothetical protein
MAPFVVGMGLRHGWPWALAMAVLGGAVGALVSSLRIELGPWWAKVLLALLPVAVLVGLAVWG